MKPNVFFWFALFLIVALAFATISFPEKVSALFESVESRLLLGVCAVLLVATAASCIRKEKTADREGSATALILKAYRTMIIWGLGGSIATQGLALFRAEVNNGNLSAEFLYKEAQDNSLWLLLGVLIATMFCQILIAATKAIEFRMKQVPQRGG